MLFFFMVDLGTDALVAFGKTTQKIGGSSAYTVFFAFYGLAFMAFRSELSPREMKDELKGSTPDPQPALTTQPSSDATKTITPAAPLRATQ